jgi:hypothetical protein
MRYIPNLPHGTKDNQWQWCLYCEKWMRIGELCEHLDPEITLPPLVTEVQSWDNQ